MIILINIAIENASHIYWFMMRGMQNVIGIILK
jgi:hypothetical protein